MTATGKHCFSEPCEGSDLVLIAEGERFHVHSSVVAWQCHVLHVHLRQTGSREVVLPNKSVDDVLSLLYVLYPFHRPTITGRFSPYSCSIYPFHRPAITGKFSPPFVLYLPVLQAPHHG